MKSVKDVKCFWGCSCFGSGPRTALHAGFGRKKLQKVNREQPEKLQKTIRLRLEKLHLGKKKPEDAKISLPHYMAMFV